MNKKLIIYFIFTIIIFRFYFLFKHYFELNYLFSLKSQVIQWSDAHYSLSLFIFLLSFILFMSLSIPVAAMFSILSGMIFGPFTGFIVSTLGATIGAIFSILINRYFLSDFIRNKFEIETNKLEAFIKNNAKLCFFSLRFSPLFPFYLVNLLLSVIHFRWRDYLIFGSLGKIPNLIIFNFIGSSLREAQTFKEINVIPFFLGMTFISIIPWLFKNYIESKNYHSEA